MKNENKQPEVSYIDHEYYEHQTGKWWPCMMELSAYKLNGIKIRLKKRPPSSPESKEVESVPVKSAEEILKSKPEWNYGQYRTKECLEAMEYYISSKQARIDELEYKLTKLQVTNPIEVIKNRVEERIKELVKTKPRYSNARMNELLEILKLIQ